jgi:hypothetical protein
MKRILLLPIIALPTLACIEPSPGNAWLADYHEEVLAEQTMVQGSDVIVTISLDTPQTVAETAELLSATEIDATRFMVFARGPDGLTGTLFTQAPIDRLATEIDLVLTDAGATLIGVAAVVGSLPSDKIVEVQARPEVFLVDPALPEQGGEPGAAAAIDSPVAWEHFAELGILPE